MVAKLVAVLDFLSKAFRYLEEIWGDFIKSLIRSQIAHTKLCTKNSSDDIKWNYHHAVWVKQYNEKRILTKSERRKIYNDAVKFGVKDTASFLRKHALVDPKF